MRHEVTEINEYQIVLHLSQNEVNDLTDFMAYCVNHLVDDYGNDGVEPIAKELMTVFLGVRER